MFNLFMHRRFCLASVWVILLVTNLVAWRLYVPAAIASVVFLILNHFAIPETRRE